MEILKNMGIWMDHSMAKMVDLNSEINSRSIYSSFTKSVKEETLNRSETIMQNKEQEMDEAFYKEIGKEILRYDHVVLFGPTNAKTELSNYLKKDLHFENIKIETKPSDKMSENEQYAFVRAYFKNE